MDELPSFVYEALSRLGPCWPSDIMRDIHASRVGVCSVVQVRAALEEMGQDGRAERLFDGQWRSL